MNLDTTVNAGALLWPDSSSWVFSSGLAGNSIMSRGSWDCCRSPISSGGTGSYWKGQGWHTGELLPSAGHSFPSTGLLGRAGWNPKKIGSAGQEEPCVTRTTSRQVRWTSKILGRAQKSESRFSGEDTMEKEDALQEILCTQLSYLGAICYGPGSPCSFPPGPLCGTVQVLRNAQPQSWAPG